MGEGLGVGMSASDDSDRAHPPAPSRKREGEASAALRNAAARLAAVSGTPRLDAELLMAHALGVERDRLLLDPARFDVPDGFEALVARRSEEHTSELQSLMRISYAVFCLKKKKTIIINILTIIIVPIG